MSYTRQTQHTNGNEIDFIQVDSVVFPTGTPVNAVNATGTLTFTGVVADTQLVTIGTEVYEFDASGGVTTGNIAVDVSGGVTASAAVTALVAAITANTTSAITAVDGTGDTVVVTAKIAGVSGNAIVSTTTCTNGSWGATKLAGGINGTATNNIGLQFEDTSYYYLSNEVNTIKDKNWKRIAKGSAY